LGAGCCCCCCRCMRCLTQGWKSTSRRMREDKESSTKRKLAIAWKYQKVDEKKWWEDKRTEWQWTKGSRDESRDTSRIWGQCQRIILKAEKKSYERIIVSFIEQLLPNGIIKIHDFLHFDSWTFAPFLWSCTFAATLFATHRADIPHLGSFGYANNRKEQ